MNVIMQLIFALTVACAIPAALGAIEVVLAWCSRRTAYRNLPAPDSPDLRVKRAMDAYRAANSYRGL